MPLFNVRFTISAVKDAVVSFKIDKSLKAKLSAIAKAESRSLSNCIEEVFKKKLLDGSPGRLAANQVTKTE